VLKLFLAYSARCTGCVQHIESTFIWQLPVLGEVPLWNGKAKRRRHKQKERLLPWGPQSAGDDPEELIE